MTTHFTADLHLGHKGIIAMSNRPFASIEEHDRALETNWNAVVAPRDDVWVVGDFAHRADPSKAAAIFRRLNGSKHLVLGNHDGAETQRLSWASVSVLKEVAVEGQRIVMMHYAMRTWPGAARGALHLYGHSHGRMLGTARSLDVGVDCWGYAPVSLPEIKARLALSAEVGIFTPDDGSPQVTPGWWWVRWRSNGEFRPVHVVVDFADDDGGLAVEDLGFAANVPLAQAMREVAFISAIPKPELEPKPVPPRTI